MKKSLLMLSLCGIFSAAVSANSVLTINVEQLDPVNGCIEPLKMRNKINRDLVEKCWNKWVKKLRKMGLGEKIKPFLFVK